MVMINRNMFSLTQALADEKPFRDSVQLSEQQEEPAYGRRDWFCDSLPRVSGA